MFELIESNSFLSDLEKEIIDEAFWSENNSWRYQPITNDNFSAPGIIDLKEGYDICYFTFEPTQDLKVYDKIKPIILKFLESNNVHHLGILRIKLNITPTHDKISQCPPHVDTKKPHLNFIYYINDSEGDTVIYNELADFNNIFTNPTVFKKIKPERGKAILFDGRQFHSVTPPSRLPLRGVINALIELESWPD